MSVLGSGHQNIPRIQYIVDAHEIFAVQVTKLVHAGEGTIPKP